MCGIAGWINLTSDLSQQKDIIEAMTETLVHRGPDASGFWLSPSALLGHRRLIVVDPSGGIQPMVRQYGDKKYILVYNGELYNTSELRSELEACGHRFYTTSDTEVLLVSYIEWGESCIERLNGIFAFAIWSELDKKLFMGRDRFGVKPLFYALRGNSMIFASELKSLLANPLIKPEINSEGLAEIFALGPARTPGHGVFKDVFELKPAQCGVFDSRGFHLRSYWKLVSQPHTDSLEITIKTVHDLVMDAIERQLVSDVPLCTFLSGGLDSSAITAVSAKYFEKKGRGKLHTFSIDYIDNSKYFKPSDFQPNADAPWVKRMSEEFGTEHHNIELDTPMLVKALVDAVNARDIPGMADIDSSLLLFCREIKQNATVTLSGECADEVFGGYPWFHRADMLNANTFPWSRNLSERTKVLSSSIKDMIKPQEYVQRRYIETRDEVPRLPGESPEEARRREIFYLNINWFMSCLLDRKDRMSMATGLEVRVPYCDHRLVQYVWNIPWEMKMLYGREKGLLRKALEGVLPEDVLWRKKSPYPKTHNPSYEKVVKEQMEQIFNDGSSPLMPLLDRKIILEMLKSGSDYGKPWFGQLMAGPQMLAYLIQTDNWMRKFRVRIV